MGASMAGRQDSILLFAAKIVTAHVAHQQVPLALLSFRAWT
jgi:hypothetical protein